MKKRIAGLLLVACLCGCGAVEKKARHIAETKGYPYMAEPANRAAFLSAVRAQAEVAAMAGVEMVVQESGVVWDKVRDSIKPPGTNVEPEDRGAGVTR